MRASGRRVLRVGTVAFILVCLGNQPDSTLAAAPGVLSASQATKSPRDNGIVDLLVESASRPVEGSDAPGGDAGDSTAPAILGNIALE